MVPFVRPVGTPSGTPEKAPLVFKFKTPRIPRSGQQLRPETEPRRKSPPPREVGPREDVSEGEVEEKETQPEISEGDQASQGGEPVDAPLGSIFKPHWGEWYAKCPTFQDTWEVTQDYTTSHIWPVGLQVVEGRMFLENKLCVPTPLQKQWVREIHAMSGHVGYDRFWTLVGNQFEWADDHVVQEFAKRVSHECDTCQACVRPHNRFGPIVYAPIPPDLMAHVAIDVFSMPSVQVEGKNFDCVVVCVDRLSGWIIAVPECTVGLTGIRVAKAMVKEWYGFGIPTRITTDQGAQFANAWWRTMCGFLGITHVYTQPYHHQANGRGERAGQQILEILRKINSDHKINLVNALPRVLRLIHDTPGEAGLSPYEIVFGRQMFVANVTYKPRRECEVAHLMFERMK